MISARHPPRRALALPIGIFTTSAFRIAGVSAAVFVVGVLMLFAFVYWQSSIEETRQIDRFIERDVAAMEESQPNELGRLAEANGGREQRAAYIGIFDNDGQPLSGNLSGYPADLPLDGRAHAIAIGGLSVRAAAVRLNDGRVLVVARDVGELKQLQRVVLRGLVLGVIPAIVLALAAGAWLSWRALRRVRAVHQAAEQIVRGNFAERLPRRGAHDDFDRLADAVNRMLDEIGHLLDQIKGVGDNIAHDLRTPLTRVRARLERGQRTAGSQRELAELVEDAIAGLDQALGIVTALLRITELEDGRRRAAFRQVDLASLIRDVAELYEPIAEDAGIVLRAESAAPQFVHGDRDLLVEAIANIVDNAIKFAPQHSEVRIELVAGRTGPIVRVTDRGTGIPKEEREAVMRRFYRMDKSRHRPGSGLGLGLVDAIMRLHNFHVEIADGDPGCIFDLVCAAPATATPAGAAPLKKTL